MLGYIKINGNNVIHLCNNARTFIENRKKGFFSKKITTEEEEILSYIDQLQEIQKSDTLSLELSAFLKLRNFCKRNKLI